jgi:spore coat polysaccharide biosynthesis protein SpsF
MGATHRTHLKSSDAPKRIAGNPMLKTLGIVQVRHPSGKKVDSKIARKLGGKPLLEVVVRRITDCQRLDGVVVVLADDEPDDQIRQLVPPDVPVFSGSARDPLATFASVLDEFKADSVVRLCAHNPFIDPVLIDRLVSTADAHPTCDYISYCCADGRPTILTQLGVFAEWCSASALRRAHREARKPADREHLTAYLYAHPELFNVRLIPLPAELDRDDLRLKIDFEEDWEHAQVIFEALGHEEWDWQRIADLLDSQPALRKRMAMLNRATVRV